jgi:hypothetical protein
MARFSTGARDFSLLHNVHTGSGAPPPQPSMQWVTVGSFAGISRSERDTDNSQLVPRLEMVELYIHFPTRLHDVVLH